MENADFPKYCSLNGSFELVHRDTFLEGTLSTIPLQSMSPLDISFPYPRLIETNPTTISEEISSQNEIFDEPEKERENYVTTKVENFFLNSSINNNSSNIETEDDISKIMQFPFKSKVEEPKREKARGRLNRRRVIALTMEEQYKNKMRSDNVGTKIKTCFFQFVFDFVNLRLKKYGIKFINIKRSIKDKIALPQFKTLFLSELLTMQNEKRNGLLPNKNYNAERFELAKNLPELSDILSLSLQEILVSFFVGMDKQKFMRKYGNVNWGSTRLKFFDDLVSDKNQEYNRRLRYIMELKFLK